MVDGEQESPSLHYFDMRGPTVDLSILADLVLGAGAEQLCTGRGPGGLFLSFPTKPVGSETRIPWLW
jgi:hypothetical protein